MTSPSSASPDSTTTCASCGTIASGRYCANCGAVLTGVACSSCSAELSPGAKFCHRCGAPTAGAPPTPETRTNSLPWIVAALAFLALFAMAAGRGFNAKRSNTVDGSSNALPQAGPHEPGAPPHDQAGGGCAPPNFSLLPPGRARPPFKRLLLPPP